MLRDWGNKFGIFNICDENLFMYYSYFGNSLLQDFWLSEYMKKKYLEKKF